MHSETMNIVVVGHVDHGKSTVMGRLLADSNSLPDGKLERVKKYCERNSKPFEYAFLLDSMKDEQAQGITIDVARIFFQSEKRDYMIIDAPGHIEFLKNMISGAAHAEAALLVIDAGQGVQENSKRHAYMLSLLGIKQFAVVINKMDLVDYSEERFEEIEKEFTGFLAEIGLKADIFIPASAMNGVNITTPSEKMPWYKGPPIFEQLDQFEAEKALEDRNFRMSIQGVYRFTEEGDDRRIFAGTIDCGTLKRGDEVMFHPSGKISKIKSIERFGTELTMSAGAGQPIGFTLEQEIYVKRGELVTKKEEAPAGRSREIKASIFWLGKRKLHKSKEYVLKIGTMKVSARLEKIERVIDASTLLPRENPEFVKTNEVAECVLHLNQEIAFDSSNDNPNANRFVLVDDFTIAGGGSISEESCQRNDRNQSIEGFKNPMSSWQRSSITREERELKFSHRPKTYIITGAFDSERKEFARKVERQIFENGGLVSLLEMSEMGHSANSVLNLNDNNEVWRLGEASYLLNNSGVSTVISVNELSQSDFEILESIIDTENLQTLWVGENVNTDLKYDKKMVGEFDLDQLEVRNIG